MRLAAAILFLLSGCAPAPTYDEIEAEAKLTGDYTKLDRYEARLLKAEQLAEWELACNADNEHIWVCQSRYLRSRKDCGCMLRTDLKRMLRDLGMR